MNAKVSSSGVNQLRVSRGCFGQRELQVQPSGWGSGTFWGLESCVLNSAHVA